MTSFEAAERALDPGRLLEHFVPSKEFCLYHDGERISYEAMAEQVRGSFPGIARIEGGFTTMETRALAPDAALVQARFRETITTRAGEVVRRRGVASWLWGCRDGDWRIECGQVDHYPGASDE